MVTITSVGCGSDGPSDELEAVAPTTVRTDGPSTADLEACRALADLDDAEHQASTAMDDAGQRGVPIEQDPASMTLLDEADAAHQRLIRLLEQADDPGLLATLEEVALADTFRDAVEAAGPECLRLEGDPSTGS